MKPDLFVRILSEMKRNEASATHLAVGALLVVSILYATTMI
jgi:hypothetical protein